MISDKLTERVHELATKGEAFVTATVVRVQHPTSVEPGTVACWPSGKSFPQP